MRTPDPAPTLVLRGLSKAFGATKVLHEVDLRVEAGEFVGLMGPNGAGKSTLIKVLDGVHAASGGTIEVGDEVVPSLAGRPDVGVVHQDLGLVEALSALENLRLGERPLRLLGPVLDRRAERRAAISALERVGLEWAVDTPIGELEPGEQALVAIARAFARGARILIVDEATSTLPPADAERVIAALRDNVALGATVIMVTHKLHEVLDATSRVVVLLDGRLAADQPTEGMDRQALVDLLLQHEMDRAAKVAPDDAHDAEPGPVLVELAGACAGRAGPVDLVVRGGEVLGLTGLPGSGLHDIAFLVHGSVRPTAGEVRRSDGLRTALVPPHRETQGGFDELSVLTNLTVSSLGRWRSPLRLLSGRRERHDGAAMARRLDVRPAGTDTAYGVLSGGNKQKVVFGRALLQEPGVFVLCEPTRGVDVGTRSEIYALIDELRATGAAVLVASSDAEDLLAVCDTVAVVSDGRASAPQPVSTMQPEDLEVLV